ncbi:MAG: DUF2796 domain-containing protein [Azoarcus sp.]|nr:DUF2796 domain-containing protein [Azoarcus sp.]
MTIQSGRSPLAALACVAALITASTFPSPAFSHGSHTHGHATLTLVVDANGMKGEFNFPLESLLGFDYPPKTPSQQQTLDALKIRLGQLDKFIEPAPEAVCTPIGANVSPDLETADPSADIANIVHSFRFECDKASALRSVYFTAFRNHPGLKQLRVKLTAPAGSKTLTVRPKFPAITF